jgi:hypothetical protein
MIIAAFLLLSAPFAHTEQPTLIFPEEIYSFDDLVFDDDALYIISYRDHTLFKLDRFTGALLKRHVGKGQGPGEWNWPQNVAVSGDKVYVFDQA